MEQLHNSSSSSEEEDVISSTPTENVVILNCLPIQDAVTTCILSKKWRLMWTLVTQVLFDGIFQGLAKCKYCYDGKDLRRLRSWHLEEGRPVTKFKFTVPNNMTLDVEDVNHWIQQMSIKQIIKEVTIINKHEKPLKLPAHDLLISCPELRHLNLHNCCLHDDSSLPTNLIINLLTLELDQVTCSNLGEIITHAPFLEVLKISHRDPIGKLKLVDHIAKLENLKTLHVPLYMIEDENNTASSRSIIFQLGVYLPKLQELNLDFHKCLFLGDDDVGATKSVSTAATACFPCLKSLALYAVDFTSGSMLSCVIGMIWCSPNLHTLNITVGYTYYSMLMACFRLELENNTMRRLQQLQHVVFTSFNYSSGEVALIKYLLACSPLLKKIVIHARKPTSCFKLLFTTKLLMFPRASPKAQVTVI